MVRGRRRARPARVTFVTRSGCSLCAEAEPVVERLAAEAGVAFELLDVDAAGVPPEQRAEHTDHVPVVLLDGMPHSRWFVDEPALRKALAGRA